MAVVQASVTCAFATVSASSWWLRNGSAGTARETESGGRTGGEGFDKGLLQKEVQRKSPGLAEWRRVEVR